MGRLRLLLFFAVVLGLSGLLLVLTGCGGGGGSFHQIVAPSYSLSATALSPASVTAGGMATSTITVTPANGYTGSVTLSCSSVTGGAPAPTCVFSPSPALNVGNGAVTSMLTVTTESNTPAANYTITVTGSDANKLAPSNGPQMLTLAVTSYTLGATALSPASVTAGGTSTSTITVTPANGYTGSVIFRAATSPVRPRLPPVPSVCLPLLLTARLRALPY